VFVRFHYSHPPAAERMAAITRHPAVRATAVAA
jgi:hypothetical protein